MPFWLFSTPPPPPPLPLPPPPPPAKSADPLMCLLILTNCVWILWFCLSYRNSPPSTNSRASGFQALVSFISSGDDVADLFTFVRAFKKARKMSPDDEPKSISVQIFDEKISNGSRSSVVVEEVSAVAPPIPTPAVPAPSFPPSFAGTSQETSSASPPTASPSVATYVPAPSSSAPSVITHPIEVPPPALAIATPSAATCVPAPSFSVPSVIAPMEVPSAALPIPGPLAATHVPASSVFPSVARASQETPSASLPIPAPSIVTPIPGPSISVPFVNPPIEAPPAAPPIPTPPAATPLPAAFVAIPIPSPPAATPVPAPSVFPSVAEGSQEIPSASPPIPTPSVATPVPGPSTVESTPQETPCPPRVAGAQLAEGTPSGIPFGPEVNPLTSEVRRYAERRVRPRPPFSTSTKVSPEMQGLYANADNNPADLNWIKDELVKIKSSVEFNRSEVKRLYGGAPRANADPFVDETRAET